MKTWKLSNDKGFEKELDAGTTRKDAELILAAMPAGWTLTSTGSDGRAKPTRRSAYSKNDRHGFWPTRSAIPREEALQRVLRSEPRVRMNDAPVVTMQYDPADRPLSATRTGHGSRCYCTDCLTDKK